MRKNLLRLRYEVKQRLGCLLTKGSSLKCDPDSSNINLNTYNDATNLYSSHLAEFHS
jgi:hypothetical protein